jgi:Fic/DOC family
MTQFMGFETERKNLPGINSSKFLTFSNAILDSVAVLSRTVQEELNFSSNSQKKYFFIEKNPKIVKGLIENNLKLCTIYLWHCSIRNNIDFHNILPKLYRILHNQILTPTVFLRTGIQNHNRVAPSSDIEHLYLSFIDYLNLSVKNMSSINESRAIAAKAFFDIVRDHYFVDGCGKIGVLICFYILLKSNSTYPKLNDRSEFAVNPFGYQYFSHKTLEYDKTLQDWNIRFLCLFPD